MSSMAAYAIDMGMDPCVGPDGREWEESTYRRPKINRDVFGDDSKFDNLGYETPLGRRDKNHSINSTSKSNNLSVSHFNTAKEAFSFAKDNIGSVVKRSSDGNGFNVTIKQ